MGSSQKTTARRWWAFVFTLLVVGRLGVEVGEPFLAHDEQLSDHAVSASLGPRIASAKGEHDRGGDDNPETEEEQLCYRVTLRSHQSLTDETQSILIGESNCRFAGVFQAVA